MRLRSLLKVAQSGDLRERARVIRDGQAAVRVAMVGSALELGILEALRTPRTPAGLAAALSLDDTDLLTAYLRTLVAGGLVDTRDGTHRLSRRGRAVLDDDVVRAGYEAFSDFHSGVYRDLPAQLRGGLPRNDVAVRGEVIARVSRAMEPFISEPLAREIRAANPRRVLDVGCGDGWHLAHMLRLAPRAHGIGIELDESAAALGRRTLHDQGVADRAEILTTDVRAVAHDVGQLGGPVDVALLANVLYYVPVGERTNFLRSIGALLAPGGRLIVINTVADGSTFSRHFDLLLRAQAGEMELPTVDELTRHLTDAGLAVATARRISPGEPLCAVVALGTARN